MTVRIHNITVDAGNAYAQSLWWTQVIGWQPNPDDPNEPGHEQCWIGPGDGSPGLLFINVPEGNPGEPRTGLRSHFCPLSGFGPPRRVPNAVDVPGPQTQTGRYGLDHPQHR